MLTKLHNELRLLFRKDKESYRILYNILGFLPDSLEPYRIALTHSSLTTSANKKRAMCNERLEFLGDAIIDAVVSDLLYTRFKKEREGFLTKSRSNLVCRETLNKVAIQLGLDKLVLSHNVGRQHNNYVYGNAFEAFVGAVYIDKGYDACKKFLLQRVFDHIVNVSTAATSDVNHKSRLIELSQKKHFPVEYRLVEEKNNSHGQYFVSEVYVCGRLFGSGDGFSKRESQQKASKAALEKLAGCNIEELKGSSINY
ncbi:MAG: ribonuclease III [Bacteroidaceae bacterium]|nr:ribonuclease III [Bacteroidaceae bacterium]